MEVASLFFVLILTYFLWIFFRGSSTRNTDIRAEWNTTRAPGQSHQTPKRRYALKGAPVELASMSEPTGRLFTYQDERKAAKACQRLWIRYKDKSGNITERKLEIYHPENDEVVFAWCCLKREPRTFARRNIQSWQLLPERFEFDPIVNQYWEEEGTRDMSEKLPWRRWLVHQPDEVSRRYS